MLVFLKLNSNEKLFIEKIIARRKYAEDFENIKTAYERCGNFTICIIDHKGILYSGISKRCMKDKLDSAIGKNIALARAVDNLGGKRT